MVTTYKKGVNIAFVATITNLTKHDLVTRECMVIEGEVDVVPLTIRPNCTEAMSGSEKARSAFARMFRPWLPDGYSRIFKIVCVWPFGLLDYGSATLRCKI